MNTIRYIADLHFRHKNAIAFDNRPFSSIEEMEERLIENWNRVVQKGDTTYIVGDFCWGKEPAWLEIVPRLNGNKVLILGNHDLKGMSGKLKKYFADIKPYKEITDNKRHVILCHYPILFYKSSWNADNYMICGHVHTTRENALLEEWRQTLRESCVDPGDSRGQIYNVGCMMPYMDYTPRTLDEILAATQ